jgi:DnaJ-class molecular chaperone
VTRIPKVGEEGWSVGVEPAEICGRCRGLGYYFLLSTTIQYRCEDCHGLGWFWR